MRNLLEGKVNHYTNFADAVFKKYRNIRFGLESCGPGTDLDLASIRKDIVDWQSLEDEDALTAVSINYMGWLPVYYNENDTTVQFTPPAHIDNPYQVYTTNGSGTLGVNFGYGTDSSTNLIQVNSGGCITNINLNPVINQGTGSFVYEQLTPALVWNISHGLHMIPNVRTETLDGTDIEGTVEVINTDTLRIVFNTPYAGRAYLS